MKLLTHLFTKALTKKILFWGGAFVGTFAASAASMFFVVPQQVIVDHIDQNPDGVESEEIGRPQAFVNKLLANATSGIGLEINHLDFVIPGATKSVNGEEVTYQNRISNIEGKNPKVSLSLEELSLAGISLKAELPLEYNGMQRELDLGLLGQENKNLYFAIADIDGEDRWSAGYQVDVSRYVSEEIDPETGGAISYEYGKLDFVLHDILEILSNGGINIDTYGKIGDLFGGDSSSTDSSFNTDELLDALNTITESEYEGAAYFTLDLPLGGETYSIGLKSDEDLNLVGLDIPSKTSEKSSQTIAGKDWTLELSATVTSVGAGDEFDWSIPDGWQALPKLDDSLSLYERVASLVASPKFGLELDVTMEHKEEEDNSIKEKAHLNLNGNADLSWNSNEEGIQGMNFNSASASLSFVSMKEDESGNWVDDTNKQLLSAYINNSDASNVASAYLNVADTLKVQTNKTMLDELMGKFSSVSESSNPLTAVEEKETDIQLETVINTIEDVISALRGVNLSDEPAVYEGLKNQHYEAILALIQNVRIENNLVAVTIDLSGLGFDDASIILTLNGDDSNSLLDVAITNLDLKTLNLDIHLATKDYETIDPSSPTWEGMESWDNLDKLPGLVDPIKNIVDEKKANIALSASISKQGTMDVYGDVEKPEGLDISGNIALDFSKQSSLEDVSKKNPFLIEGTASLSILEKTSDYYQDHHVVLDVANAGEDLLASGNALYFHYDSQNDENAPALENRTNPNSQNGINGKIGIGSIDALIDSLTSTIANADDRFSRLSKFFAAPAEASLISDLISGNYFKIANYSILKEAHLGESNDSFLIDGSALGLDSDIELGINFEQKQCKSLMVATAFGEEGAQTELAISLGFEDVSESTKFATLNHDDNYDDYSGLLTLADYAASTVLLGLENGEGTSTYAIEGGVNIQLGDYETQLAKANVAASIKGNEIKLHASLNNIPVIRGINAPDDPRYFRDFELGGDRDASFYYYSPAEIEAESQLLMTRRSNYGRLANVNDSVKLTGEAFKEDALAYILQYFLGVNESFFAEEDNSIVAQNGEAASAIHVDDLIKGFSETYNEEDSSISWNLTINLNSLLGVNILDDVVLTINGGTFSSFKAINLIKIATGVSIASDQGNRLSLVKANVNLALTNLHDGVYHDGWTPIEEDYSTNFLTFEEDGTSTPMGIYSEATDLEGGSAWRHGVDPTNKGHRNYYLGLSK